MSMSSAQMVRPELQEDWLATTTRRRSPSRPAFAIVALLSEVAILVTVLGLVCGVARRNNSPITDEVFLTGLGPCLVTCLILRSRMSWSNHLSDNRPRVARLLCAVSVGAVLLSLNLKLLPIIGVDEIPQIGLRVGAWIGFALLLLSGFNGLLTYLSYAWGLGKPLRRRVLLVGATELSRLFIERVANDPSSDIEIVGVYTDNGPNATNTLTNGYSLAVGSLQDLKARCEHDAIDMIILTLSMLNAERITPILNELQNLNIKVSIPADIVGRRFDLGDVETVGRSPIISLKCTPMDEWQRLQKALFDRLVGSLLLIFLCPIFILVAIIIKIGSPGPILFKQSRMGFNNRVFTVYKFRTMVNNGDPGSLNGAHQAKRGDHRITPIGKYLRKYSIDELPQLVNVIKGEMSLVGPRPHPLNTKVGDKLFQDVVDHYSARHRVLPGITGWAQVNGWRGETIVAEQLKQRVAHDLYYIDNWSLAFDLRILVLTITREILSKNAF